MCVCVCVCVCIYIYIRRRPRRWWRRAERYWSSLCVTKLRPPPIPFLAPAPSKWYVSATTPRPYTHAHAHTHTKVSAARWSQRL